MNDRLPSERSATGSVQGSSALYRTLMLALTAVLVIALVFIATQQGNQGGLNIPITGERAETDQNLAKPLPAGKTAQGEFKVFEPFARPETWGLLAAVAGTLIFGLNLAVLSRQK